MPTKKIADEPMPCLNRQHDPPGHMVYQPGTHEHTCPGCGYRQTFRVSRMVC